MLPLEDQKYLRYRFPEFTETVVDQMICILIPGFPLPKGLNVKQSDLLLRLASGYPDIAPDMWWFNPSVVRSDGHAFKQTEVQEHYLGRSWQRWSRHLDAGHWRPGIDNLETYLALVQKELNANK